MVSRFGSLRYFVALLAFLLVPHNICSATISKADLMKFAQMNKHSQNFLPGNLQAALSSKEALSHRAMLQFRAIPLCSFANDTCSADLQSNLPDTDTVAFILKILNCKALPDETACNGDPFCRWSEEGCILDFTFIVKDCLNPNFAVLRRATDCEQLATQSKCTNMAGCEWSPLPGTALGDCEISTDDVVEVLSNDQALLNAFQKNQDCFNLTSCSGQCELQGEDCIFPGLRDAVWVTSTTPFCNMIKQLFTCISPADACPQECAVFEGRCDLGFLSDAFIDITFVSNPTLGDAMKAAVRECPNITSAADCAAFSP